MKKLFLLFCLILSGCYDSARLGYLHEYYPPQNWMNVDVFYSVVPDSCDQIGISTSPVEGYLNGVVQSLRKEAADMGANHVNIVSIVYTGGLFGSGQKMVLATFYLCKDYKE